MLNSGTMFDVWVVEGLLVGWDMVNLWALNSFVRRTVASVGFSLYTNIFGWNEVKIAWGPFLYTLYYTIFSHFFLLPFPHNTYPPHCFHVHCFLLAFYLRFSPNNFIIKIFFYVRINIFAYIGLSFFFIKFQIC